MRQKAEPEELVARVGRCTESRPCGFCIKHGGPWGHTYVWAIDPETQERLQRLNNVRNQTARRR
jgi:hypothetical protein